MIQVDGFKAFHGDMKITPKSKTILPFYIKDKDWLYKPETNCWYGDGRSFSAEICTIIETKQENLKERCTKCNKPLTEKLITAYGESRCENCWDDYLMTDKGKVEYLIGIVKGDYPMDYFDADFLGWVACCWAKYRTELNLPMATLIEIENKAKNLGLL